MKSRVWFSIFLIVYYSMCVYSIAYNSFYVISYCHCQILLSVTISFKGGNLRFFLFCGLWIFLLVNLSTNFETESLPFFHFYSGRSYRIQKGLHFGWCIYSCCFVIQLITIFISRILLLQLMFVFSSRHFYI